MRTLYSVLGFPVMVPVDVKVDTPVYFYSRVIDEIATARRSSDRPSFEDELEQIKAFSKIWELTGGFFAPMTPAASEKNPVKVSANVLGFILETANLLSPYADGTIDQKRTRRVSFGDWRRMLEPSPDQTLSAGVPGDAMAAVTALANMPTEKLIQHWITTAGVDDLSETLHLYVGERPPATE